ncbi:exodeoxyribonuclease III [Methanococcoides methylutens]|uniref:Exodeoxyribonuclease III n=1 Tax=Methanococcoides methylutens MM1 TaxID=1434104 RepID=A0A0E3WYQ5_METMT|nr:exodeoxyribonuclease III [Methanococcoides methylutens]AKB84389.1 Exodeoxyribonuclease III [Methanococcoides methylutens MM1]
MSSISILSWNVNGLRSMVKKGFLEWVAEAQPDILCLQETKAQERQLPTKLRHIDSYIPYFFSAERKGYSGVAVYTKTQPVNVEYGLGEKRFDVEGRTLIAEYEDFVLFNIYFPNGKASDERLQYKMDFYDAFTERADGFKDEGKNVIVCGDVNTAHKEIDLARPKQNEKSSGFLPMEREWIDKFLDHGYIDTLRMFNQEPGQYSWWDLKTRARDRNVGWRIDYFFASESLRNRISSAYILPDVMGSDHCPIGLDLEIDQ